MEANIIDGDGGKTRQVPFGCKSVGYVPQRPFRVSQDCGSQRLLRFLIFSQSPGNTLRSQKCAVSGKFSLPPSSSLVSITSKYKYSLRYGADDEILKEVGQRWISFKAIPCRGAL